MRAAIVVAALGLACSLSQAQVSEREPAEATPRGRSIRELDAEREQERRARDAEWRRSVRERNESRPAQMRAAPPVENAKPPRNLESRETKPPRKLESRDNLRVACRAAPVCQAKYTNVCKAVSNSYSGGDAMSAGNQDIVRRCVAANSPDPCSGECTRSCSSTARCDYAAR
jgi:hypothetical protein